MPRPKEEPIRRTTEKGPGNANVEVERHPAFGTIVFHRTQGNPGKLFGSHINHHMGSIIMEVHNAERRHDLSHDWYFSNRRAVIQVEMSFVQFSELLTSMNMGDGVPCTIRRFNGEFIPYIPDDLETEQEKVAEGFKQEMDELSVELQQLSTRVSEILEKKSLNKEDRANIKRAFDRVLNHFRSHAPFVMDQFVESAEKTAKAAKAEVEGFLTNALHTAGLEGLKKQLLGDNIEKALPSGENDSERG
jgi:ElaB/YqjD/DUF883 family membrane-anchored ribosome-binding protein